ncbi:hypothetical protein BK125_27270 [Paenibacillus odorifer]|uniref:Uncharacterized protein n=1 Tax=Paenibacillus odorifer TaxID=189426 RepID=A0ABX3GKZ7_9BACL|nr:hypothetical protein BK125_27270 [Paenibacillus odorifer]OMD29823.1 hypothetical protein BSO21_18930 [Paenibacillus odorifer]
MGNIGKCCVKGQLCPLEITVRQLASVIFAHRHLTSGSPVIGRSLVIVFNSWLALRLCIKYAAAMHSDPDDAIGMILAF